MAKFEEEKQKKQLEQIHEKEEEQLTQILAQKYDLPYIDLSKMTIDLDYLKLIPEKQAREGNIVVFQGVGKKIRVGVRDPEIQFVKNTLNELKEKGYEIQLFLISLTALRKVWSRYKEVPEFIETSRGIIGISPERIEEFLAETTNLDKLKEAFYERVNSKENRRISELLEIILSGALGAEASDIHIEPHEKKVKLRIRLDGVLHDIIEFDFRPYQLLLSRIKLVSEMKLNIKQKAQDGRFSIKARGLELEVRSSSLPGPYGESIVLRILNPKTISISLEDLGLHPHLYKLMEEEIKKPNGMILTTGPTGSGKTTTLYAFLKKRSSPDVKIITIEEPIEYHLKNVTQTQTVKNKDYDFSTGLKSILRQDPDIIMVGEIRDLETASTALNAALTGHLVFSTLHTNDAAGTIPRLIDLGANPSIIAPAINVSMAQRLIRKLCNNCKVDYKAPKEEQEKIKKVIETFPKEIDKPDTGDFKLFKAGDKNCDKCSDIRYKGRVGIFEAILIDSEIEQLVLKNPSEAEVKAISAKQPLLNMQQDAILKILSGATSFEETSRVIQLTD